MPKAEWGVKRVCPSCSTRFYDLQQDPMTCPNCAYAFSLASLRASATRATATGGGQRKGSRSAAKEEEETAPVEEGSGNADLGDEVLEDDTEDNVSLDDIAEVDSDDENG